MHALIFALAFQQGISLGLFHEDPDFSYQPLLKEIRAMGADHVALPIPWYQKDVRATRLAPRPRQTATDSRLLTTMNQARRQGLEILLCPIVRVEHKKSADEWRGTIRPADRDAWWRSYRSFILRYARLATRGRASHLCLGSELSTMDVSPEKWKSLGRDVRKVFRGKLVYSANWDHLQEVKLWDAVDFVGLSAYFQLAKEDRDPDVESLVRAWREVRVEVLRAARRIGKPLVITEVGYLSQDGTAEQPWNESAAEPIDLEEQRRCFEAFRRVWKDAAGLDGVYVWNWYGWGGPESREYTPRGKPAAEEICKYFGAAKCPDNYGTDWLP